MSVVAYPVAGKAKSAEICRAFVEGCGGTVARNAPELLPGDAMFFGVDASNAHLWERAKHDKTRDYYYADNSYFDATRQTYFRVTKNRLQHSGFGTSTGARFRALNIAIDPWGKDGEHIVVCPQSDHFMRTVVGFNGDWLKETLGALKTLTERPLRVRPWSPDKGKIAATLAADLRGAFCLVTWSSAAAISAIIAGVPAVTGGDCAAGPMSGDIFKLHALPRKPREQWLGVLADNQWTLAEMRDGTAWQALQ